MKRFLLCALFLATPAYADTWLDLGGVSVHSRPGFNGVNPGLGIQQTLTSHVFLATGLYRNSDYHESHYLVIAMKEEIYHAISIGFLSGFVDGYMRLNSGHITPLAAPFLSIEGRYLGMDIVLIPPAIKNGATALCFRLKVRIR